MHKFLIIFEAIHPMVFKIINHLRHHLDIAYKGKYELSITFHNQDSNIVKKYRLKGTPALIQLNSEQVIYGNFEKKDFLKYLI